MWIVCKAGFFNIVCSKGDVEKGVLTIKARSRKDLNALSEYIPFDEREIEESAAADYRFRVKAERRDVRGGFATMFNEIYYPKTKPALSKERPERDDIYLQVWGDLYAIQELDAAESSSKER